MKSTKDIIREIHNLPLYCQNANLQDLFGLFSPTHRQVIAFIYKKDNLLMIACKHPLGLLELKKDSNIKIIKELLKTFVKFRPNSNLSEISDIKFFVATEYMKKKEKFKKRVELSLKVEPYIEKSDGKFINNIKNEANSKLFEEIRGLILARK